MALNASGYCATDVQTMRCHFRSDRSQTKVIGEAWLKTRRSNGRRTRLIRGVVVRRYPKDARIITPTGKADEIQRCSACGVQVELGCWRQRRVGRRCSNGTATPIASAVAASEERIRNIARKRIDLGYFALRWPTCSRITPSLWSRTMDARCGDAIHAESSLKANTSSYRRTGPTAENVTRRCGLP